ncbi:MAG: OprO/OprP family phosphate-selective porin [Duncaniella sp.]|nr:OprO/OprP family phosphate-selective porin [Duncaniella sp.]
MEGCLRFWLAAFVALVAAVFTAGAEEKEQVSLVPRIHGAVRARYEMATAGGEERFQVRNARLKVVGDLSSAIDYFIQADLCDRGKMKILDAWARIAFGRGLSLQGGQFMMPFGVDNFRNPSNYIFINRASLVKDANNLRGVGAKLIWARPLGGGRSLTLEGGAFNPTSISDQEVWVKTLAYAAKGTLGLGRGVSLVLGGETVVPDRVRVNKGDVALGWEQGPWQVQGEYLYKHYTRDRHPDVHAWTVWGNRLFPVRWGVFNRASVQARWDGMTDHSDGKGERLETTEYARNRVTVGGTVSYVTPKVRCDLRVNWEKYFYHHGVSPAGLDAADKVGAEVVVVF